MTDARRYSEDEVKAILERALRRQAAFEGVPHEDLVAAAGEIGVSKADLERAAQEIAESRGQTEAKAAILARRKSGFLAHLYSFIGVNAFLFALNAITSPGVWWFVIPLVGWAIGLFFHARAAISKEVSEHAIARELGRADRHKRRLERKLAAERRSAERQQRKQRIEKGAADLGAAVEDGVGILLSKVADEIRKNAERAAGHYEVKMADKRGSRVRVDPSVASPSEQRGTAAADAEADAEADAVSEQLRADAEHRRNRQ